MSNAYNKSLVNPDGSLKRIGVEIDHELAIQSTYLAGNMKNEDDRKAFAAWLVAKSKARQKTFDIPTAKEFLDTVKNSNINDEADVSNLMWLAQLPSRPYLGIGKHRGFVYCLAPSPNVLVPTQADYTDKQVCPENILGVNTNVEPRVDGWARYTNFPEKSHQRNTNIGNDSTGFAFLQLGYLQYIPVDQWKNDIPPGNHHWIDSGYAVVAMVNTDGSLGEIWILYNFYPYNEMEGGESRWQVEDDGDWGWLQGDQTRRAGARIAKDMGDLGPNAQWTLDKSFDHMPEFVAAVRMKGSRKVIRQSATAPPMRVPSGPIPLAEKRHRWGNPEQERR